MSFKEPDLCSARAVAMAFLLLIDASSDVLLSRPITVTGLVLILLGLMEVLWRFCFGPPGYQSWMEDSQPIQVNPSKQEGSVLGLMERGFQAVLCILRGSPCRDLGAMCQ